MKYTEEVLRKAAAEAVSIRHVIRLASGNDKPSGGTANHVAGLLKKYNIDTSHFTGQGHRKGKVYWDEGPGPEAYFRRLKPGSPRVKGNLLKKALLNSGVDHVCVECGNEGTHNGKPLTLQVDHVDGDWYNNEKNNLRLLCPNCHTQTANWDTAKMRL